MSSRAIYYLIRTLVALVAIPFHEAGHALAAWLLGDPTAKQVVTCEVDAYILDVALVYPLFWQRVTHCYVHEER